MTIKIRTRRRRLDSDSRSLRVLDVVVCAVIGIVVGIIVGIS